MEDLVWILVAGFVVAIWWHHNVNPTTVTDPLTGVVSPVVRVPPGMAVDMVNGTFAVATNGTAVVATTGMDARAQAILASGQQLPSGVKV